jgi:hypothetical protein
MECNRTALFASLAGCSLLYCFYNVPLETSRNLDAA